MTPAIPLANEPHTKLRGVFLLACEATKDGERVLLLEAFSEPDGHVTIDAETWPVKSSVRLDPVRSAYRFRNAAEATKFVEEAMIALEYLGCTVTMHNDVDDHPLTPTGHRQALLPSLSLSNRLDGGTPPA